MRWPRRRRGWMRAQFAEDRAGRRAEARRLAAMLQALNTLSKPVIARVNGAAYGGGVGLISVCDVAVAAAALDVAVEAEVAPYFATAPSAVAAAKRLARSLGPRIDADVIEASIARLADTWETPEAQAGVAAFLEKRRAPWDL